MIRLLFISGRGPAECRIALVKALEVLRREAEEAGLDLDIARGDAPDRYGPGSAVAIIQGDGEEAFAKSWIGSILWVAASPVRPHHKRKNWFVAVSQLPAQAAQSAILDAGDVHFEAFRAGGPGGQHQNKTESAVRAVHKPTGIAVVSRDQRSQHRNKALALERLAELLRLGEELTKMSDLHQMNSEHNKLERGRPVRRFKGGEFLPA